MGVLLYQLVSGYLPFLGENAPEVYDLIHHANYNFNYPEFKDCSP